MWPLIKRFFTDDTAFVGVVRAVCIGLGTAVATDMIDVAALGVPKGVGVLLAALGGFIRAGERNRPTT